MQRICILTDNSVQFTLNDFPGSDLVKVIPFSITDSNGRPGNRKNAGISSQEINLRIYLEDLILRFEEILILTLSGTLSSLHNDLETVLEFIGKTGNIKLFDSRTTSIGLGILVERAAVLASKGVPFNEIDFQIRSAIPLIYTLLYLPDLDYLAKGNYLTKSQAVVGDMLEIQPIFSLENDCFTPIRKVHSTRQVLEIFQDFLDEFAEPYFAALVKANRQSPVIFKNARNSSGKGSKQKEISMVTVLKDLLGPNAVVLIVAETGLT
jgi:DegV family protein with EDD domain